MLFRILAIMVGRFLGAFRPGGANLQSALGVLWHVLVCSCQVQLPFALQALVRDGESAAEAQVGPDPVSIGLLLPG